MAHFSISKRYFEWMFRMVGADKYPTGHSFNKLLEHLHRVEFTCQMTSDSDRAYDGVGLRHRFALLHDEYDYDFIIDQLHGPCSVLEMLIALAIRCEETLMSDPQYGDRTSQWFWMMIANLNLASMTDTQYSVKHVNGAISTFLNRDYEPDGRGGLFRVRETKCDFRNMDIWKQMCYFLDTML